MTTIYLTCLHSDKPSVFPNVETALIEPDGLLAMGGDLSPERLIAAYQQGIFPWFSENEPCLWWSPSKRAVFIPNKFHASRSLAKYVRKYNFQFTINQRFTEVITYCALLRGEDKVWITEEMRKAYGKLHQLGLAHSAELWLDGKLVGGLYGVNVGKVFCAESMFSLVDNASKIALWRFCEHFSNLGGELIECQMLTPHLASLGAIEIPRKQYIHMLSELSAARIW